MIRSLTNQISLFFCSLVLCLIAWHPGSDSLVHGQTTIVSNHLSANDSFYSVKTYAERIIELKQIVEIQAENSPRKDVLEEIALKANVGIAYNAELEPLNQQISFDRRTITVGDALMLVMEGTGYEPAISKTREIVLTRIETQESFVTPVEVYQETVSGRIVDAETGEALPGVNIVIQGTTTGTTTGSGGNFELQVPSLQETLVFTYIGYERQEVNIASRTEINIELVPSIFAGEELVVVGYGQMRDVKISGSIASVNFDDVESRAVSQSSLALQGQLSGVSVRQTSGNPRTSSASVVVRGLGTFSAAGTSPLVLVDGIESSIDSVDPNDIESVSVLKDAASASIYGSKAANGVILIETKKGIEGIPQFSYNSYVGLQSPTRLPEMVNSWEYAEMVNEAQVNMGGNPRYTQEEIDLFRSGSDPINYPNFDHIDFVFGSGNAIQHQHNLTMRGGTPGTRYMVSAGYYDQHGLLMRNNADRYNLRANLDADLKDNLEFNLRIAGQRAFGREPISPGGSYQGIVRGAMRNANAIPGVLPDGYFGRNETIHPEADLLSDSFLSSESSNLYTNTNLTWDILEGLSVRGQVGYTLNNSESRQFTAQYDVTPNFRVTPNRLNVTWSKSYQLTLQSVAEYVNSIGNNNIQLLGGVSRQLDEFSNISAYRDEFPNNQVTEINAGATARGTQGGTRSRAQLASVFGRANYDFAEKYLFEVNFRYDGSSRFAEENRWGFFPSVSAGWRISQESFFQDALPWVNELKIRASWGELGNQSIGNYPYQNLIALGQNYAIGNEIQAGAAITTISNRDITWETTSMIDIGIDMALFNNRLNFSTDYFIKETDDILYNITVSRLLGATPSATNAATVENRGWDFDLSYRNVVGNFFYGISGNLSINHNEVTRLANVDRDVARGLFIGHPIGSTYGFVSDGLFVDESELNNAPDQPFGFLAMPGGIKYRAIGENSESVTSADDRTVIGNPLPITTYGLTLSGGYRDFDFNMLFQGEGGREVMPTYPHFFPLDNDGNVQRDVYENRWTTDNPDPNAKYPRMVIVPTSFYQQNPVDYWYRDATFVRLKNVQVGYNLPGNITSSLGIQNARLYVTGENLFTLTNYYPGFDPEVSHTGTGFYPLVKQYTIGINIDF